MFSDFTCKNFLLHEIVWKKVGGANAALSPPFSLAPYYEHIMNMFQL